MTENHEGYNVRKSLKVSKTVSHVENVLSVILYQYTTSRYNEKFSVY